MRVLVTGGAGFIGSALVQRLIGAGHEVLTYDLLTYAARLEALAPVLDHPGHRFVRGDIRDRSAVAAAFAESGPDAVIHLAAESHVDRSIDDAGAFIDTNVRGTHVLLEAALDHWRGLPRARRDGFRFVQVSTDEVFGSVGDGAFTEESRYAPNSPYAASKAAGDHLARAWHRTHGLPVIVTNCTNNYGPRQHAEKLIPTVLRHALEGAPVPIYGTGANVRDWLHVEDHARGLEAVMLRGRPGATYLFGGRTERDNLTLARALCALLDTAVPRPGGASYLELISFVADRPGHDHRYAVDPSRTEAELGWRAERALDEGLRETVGWYLGNRGWLVPVSELGRLGAARAGEAAR